MKTIHVVAAVICDSLLEASSVYATARGYGDFKGKWEFPGGKIENGESPEDALKREIKEELAITINVGSLIEIIEYDYPDFHLTMECYWAEICAGKIILREHEDGRWLKKDDIDSVEWLPADLMIIEKVYNHLIK